MANVIEDTSPIAGFVPVGKYEPESEKDPLEGFVPVGREPSVRESLLSVEKKDPDRHAKVLGLADASGLPVPYVEDQYDHINYMSGIAGYDDLDSTHPATASILRDKNLAAVVRPDISSIKSVEENLGYVRRKNTTPYGTFMDAGITVPPRIDPDASYVAGYRVPYTEDMPEDNTLIRDTVRKTIPDTYKAWTAGWIQQEMAGLGSQAMIGREPEGYSERMASLKQAMKDLGTDPIEGFFSKGYSGAIQMAPQFVEQAKARLVGAALGGLTTAATTGAIAGGAGGMIAGPVGAVPAAVSGFTRGFGPGAVAGQETAGILYSFDLEGGLAYSEFEDIRDSDGRPLPKEIAQGAAIGVGAVNAAIEVAQFNTLAKMVPGAKELVNKVLRESVKEALKKETSRKALAALGKMYVGGVATESMQEVAQQFFSILGEEVGKKAAELTGNQAFEHKTLPEIGDALLEEGIQSAASFLFLGLPGALLNVRPALKNVQQAQKDAQFFSALNDSMQGNPIRERYSPAIRGLVERLKSNAAANGEEISDIGIPASALDTLFQNDPERLQVFLNTAEIEPGEFATALSQGRDIEIPLEVFAQKIAGTAEGKALENDLRIFNHSTVNEAKAETENLRVLGASGLEGINTLVEERDLDAHLEKLRPALESVYGEKDVKEVLKVLRGKAREASMKWSSEGGKNITPSEWLKRNVTDVLSEKLNQQRDQAIGGTQYHQSHPAFAGVDPNDSAQVEEARRLWEEKGTESPYFKQWFGDSKVVDAEGKPLVVYHGTKEDFSTFRAKYPDGLLFFTHDATFASQWAFGRNKRPKDIRNKNYWGEKEQAAEQRFYDEYIPIAEEYGYNSPEANLLWSKKPRAKSLMERDMDASVMPVFLKVENPFIPHERFSEVEDLIPSGMKTEAKNGAWLPYENPQIVKRLKGLGYDGVYLKEGNYESPTRDISDYSTIAVWEPSQIKSTFNQGTFDPSNPDILYQRELAQKIVDAIRSQESGPSVDSEVALPPSTDTLYQVQNLPEWKARTQAWMKANGYSQREIKRHLKAIEGQMAIFSALGPAQIEMFPPGVGENRSSKSKGTGGPFRENADPIYKITFDASAMCVKRLEAAETAAYIQSQIGRALSTSERMALVALFRAAGKTAPCLYCYVEAPRAKMAEFTQKGIDIVSGKIGVPKKWSDSMRALAVEAKDEFDNIGLADTINPNLFIDPDYIHAHLDEVETFKSEAPIVYDFISKAGLAAKANLPKRYEEYVAQILDIKQEILDELSQYAGLRFFSSSDFQAEHLADLMQAFFDMDLRKVPAHAYTKVASFVDVFGATGMKIQTSIFAKEHPDGTFSEDTYQGMEWEKAKAFREKHKDVGTVLVATSDRMVRWAMDQDWIDYIIPFHHSGLEKKFSRELGWQDFTSTQAEKVILPRIQVEAKKAEGVSRVLRDGEVVQEFPSDDKEGLKAFVKEYRAQVKEEVGKAKKIRMHEMGTVGGINDEQGTRAYLTLALERKLIPVFPAFLFKDFNPEAKDEKARLKATKEAISRWREMAETGEIDWEQINPAYFKLKKDYARTDTPFKPVKAEFNMEVVGQLLDSFLSGHEPRAKTDHVIADQLIRRINDAGGKDIGIEALRAIRDEQTLFQSAGPIYYSQLTRVAEKKLPGAGSPEQMKQMLDSWAKKGEIKQEELDWSGVREWLDGQTGKVSKKDVVEFLKANEVELEEIEKGSDNTLVWRESPFDGDNYWSSHLGPEEEGYDFSIEQKGQDDSYVLSYGASDEYQRQIGVFGTLEEAKAEAEQIVPEISSSVQGDTKYHEYKFPGGGNYKEKLLIVPPKKLDKSVERRLKEISDEMSGDISSERYTELHRERMQLGEAYRNGTQDQIYRSSHWDESNVVVHTREDDRIDTDGKKVRLVHEIQSDLHQEGKKKGYSSGKWEVFDIKTGEVKHAVDTREEAERLATGNLDFDRAKGVIDLPFKKSSTWAMLAMKKIIRQAVEDGMDRVAWTTGEQQAERYDLSKQISKLQYNDKTLKAYDHGGDEVLSKWATPEELPDIIGKEAADKLINQEKIDNPNSDDDGYRVLSGLDLKVGGEGMVGFYDKILPAEVGKYIKKWGAKVGETVVIVNPEYTAQDLAGGVDDLTKALFLEKGEGLKVHSFDITPAMRESVMQGQPLFQFAYHGTPHQFSKFSIEHIGSGEGAQYFGWGLYFTGAKEIADDYRRKLTVSTDTWYDDIIEEALTGVDEALYEEDNNDMTKEDLKGLAVEAADMALNSAEGIGAMQFARRLLAKVESLEADKFDVVDGKLYYDGEPYEKAFSRDKNTGNIYKVDIPDESDLLHFDKTIDEHSDSVRKILSDIDLSPVDSVARDLFGEDIFPLEVKNGKDVYSRISEKLGGDREASLYLKSKGIPGHSYPAGTLSNAKSGDYNYVIYDDEAVKLLEAYFQPKSSEPLASVTFSENQTIVRLFKNANLSSFLHEMGHIFVKDLERLVATGNASESTKADLEALRKFTSDLDDDAVLDSYYEENLRNPKSVFGDTPFADLTADLREHAREIAKQEKLARAFETYLLEGKAPTVELQSAFARFRGWLTAIYRSLTSVMGVEINDEVRSVFDRMLMAEDDIEAARNYHNAQANMDALLNEVASESERKRMVRLKNKMHQDALEKRTSILLKAYFKAVGGKEGRKILMDRAERDVLKDPVYQAIRDAADGGGIRVEDSEDPTVRRINQRHGGGILGTAGSVEAEMLAAKHGFKSSQDMIQAMGTADALKVATFKRLKELVARNEENIRKEMENQALAEQYGVTFPGDAEFHNDAALDVLMAEAELLRRKRDQEAKTKTSSSRISAIALKDKVRSDLAATRVREAVKFAKASAAESRASRAAETALRKGNMEEALKQKQLQAYYHAMVLESVRVRDEMGKMEREVKRFLKDASRIEYAHREQLIALANRYGLTAKKPSDPATLTTFELFLERLADNEPTGVPMFEPWLLRGEKAGNYKDLTMGELRELGAAIRWVAGHGSDHFQQLLTQKDISIATFADKALRLAAGVKSKPITPERQRFYDVKRHYRDYLANITQVQFYLMEMDGYRNLSGLEPGLNEQMFRWLADAGSREKRVYYEELWPRYEEAFKKIREAQKRLDKTYGKYFDPESFGIPVSEAMKAVGADRWTSERVISMLLNRGNKGNLAALLEGYELSLDQIDQISSLLRKDEWAAIQEIWNLIDTQYKPMDDAYFAINNIHTKKVEADPFQVRTADGELITVDGGYYPLIFDHQLSKRAEKYRAEDLLKNSEAAVFHTPAARSGFVNTRTGGLLPPRLSLGVITQHLYDTVHYYTHAAVVQDIDRITRNPEWEKEFIRINGREAYSEIRPWLKSVIRPERVISDVYDDLFTRQRMLASIAILGYNVKSASKQLLDYFPAMRNLGPGYVGKGIWSSMKDWKASAEEVRALSPYMAQRSLSIDREMREVLMRMKVGTRVFTIHGTEYTWNDVEKFAFKFIEVMDAAVTIPVWKGAFAKASELRMSPEKCIEFADDAVRITQPGADFIDLTAFQRSNKLIRLFTMFASPAIRSQNRMRFFWGAWRNGKMDTSSYFGHVLYELLAPSIARWAFYAVFLGSFMPGGDDDEKKKHWSDIFFNFLDQALGGFPLVSSVISGLEFQRGSISPVMEGVDRAKKFMGSGAAATASIWDDSIDTDEAWTQFAISTADLLAFELGVGYAPRILKTFAEGFEDLSEGKTLNPLRIVIKVPKEDRK